MVVEDVEIESGGEASKREFRRRLRFKRMPNLVQTEYLSAPLFGSYGGASLQLIASYIEGRIRSGFRPKALCLGVGGGALLGFLKAELGFQVMGVEADKEV
ncbi:methyltransferase-like protein 13 [Prunus yedoensis var. nudiflora]|uniref:Methyltransferase-like protein 13 n=1 Tax=Prunus yedoensis var. nudiflora TaxID=2094558 RepID=A0A314ZX27_PRUYE|nr:methyltransferase-like protein 13 [Prunus yedoensis var. nudiflora]